MHSKERLDKYLVDTLKVESRNLAQKLIESNSIQVNNIIINKCNHLVDKSDVVRILNDEKYVSRAAYKLLHAIDIFKIDLSNKTVIDIGSSTGGFSQVCLENKIKKIYCVDVGKNQFSSKLKEDSRVHLFEQTNFKNINAALFNDIDFITCDVSFISIKKILLKIIDLQWKNMDGVFLLKPQFELSPKEIALGKGKVKANFLENVVNDFKNFCKNNGFKIINICESPIKGAKKNNVEFLTHLRW